MTGLFSTLLYYRQGFTLATSRSIALRNKLVDALLYAALAALVVLWLSIDAISNYVTAAIVERTAAQQTMLAAAYQEKKLAESLLVNCMNGRAIRFDNNRVIFCDPAQETEL